MEFKYDVFQKQAIRYIDQGHSVLVSAPTGAGKTAIAEHVIEEGFKRREGIIYTAPIKALSNQKYRDFQERANDKVGILTGDIVLNAQAPLLIMTTEIFRNKILEDPTSLKKYGWIIYDEIHYLDDYQRGSVWEESLMFLPEHMRILGLSATIPNIDELAEWLEGIHGHNVKIVKEDNRPVPLHFYYQCQNKIYDDPKKLARFGYRSPELPNAYGGKLPHYAKLKPNRPKDLINRLWEQDLLPCIYFVFSRRETEYLAEEMLAFNFLDDQERKDITTLYSDLCQKFDLTKEPSAQHLKQFIRQGIGYHHAGMLPTLKEVVERLFTSRLLKLIFTTETFALGINMPARSVIFQELRKFYGKGFDVLRTRDFFQMAGRAGRRSIDTEGYVFCRINPHYISAGDVQRVIFGKSEKVRSQFNAAYATVLNLYQMYGEDFYDMYPRSFHYFQVRKLKRKRALFALEAKVNILKELNYIKDGQLTEKGIFASQVYGYELILAEFFESGKLEKLSIKELGVLILAMVHEPRKRATKPPLTKRVRFLEAEAKDIIRRIHRLEKTVGQRDLSKRCYFHLSPVIEAWIRGDDFQKILQHTDADEGEIVRAFRMTIQVLREISQAPISSSLREKIYQLSDLINRDVIDAEKQLRG